MIEIVRVMHCFATGFLAVACLFLANQTPQRAYGIPLCNETPCVVEDDGGGVRADYEKLAARMVRTEEPVEIKGNCYSACTILADLARPYACIWPGVAFHFHQATLTTGPEIGKRIVIDTYSNDIAGWIDANGGQPTVGWLTMNYTTALDFWPTCEKKVSGLRPTFSSTPVDR